jgi:hypothetical protein
VLHVRSDFESFADTSDGTPPAIAQLILAAERPNDDDPPFWLNWTKFDYLYVLFSEEGAANPDPQRLTLVVEGENFQLYRVLKVPQVRAEE